MPPALPVYDFDELELGPANVYYGDPAGSGADAERFLGVMGEDLSITMSVETSPLTGAQFGSIPLNKVIIGGSFQFTIPFKEISLANIALAFGNSESYTGGVAFKPRVGRDLRSLAKPLRLVKFALGGDESTDPEDTFVFYLVSPTDAEVTLSFGPTEQRVLSATFEAWPDDAHDGAWGYCGVAPAALAASPEAEERARRRLEKQERVRTRRVA
jgi:hypothetical protein